MVFTHCVYKCAWTLIFAVVKGICFSNSSEEMVKYICIRAAGSRK